MENFRHGGWWKCPVYPHGGWRVIFNIFSFPSMLDIYQNFVNFVKISWKSPLYKQYFGRFLNNVCEFWACRVGGIVGAPPTSTHAQISRDNLGNCSRHWEKCQNFVIFEKPHNISRNPPTPSMLGVYQNVPKFIINS